MQRVESRKRLFEMSDAVDEPSALKHLEHVVGSGGGHMVSWVHAEPVGAQVVNRQIE